MHGGRVRDVLAVLDTNFAQSRVASRMFSDVPRPTPTARSTPARHRVFRPPRRAVTCAHVQTRRERIQIETDHYRIVGVVTLPADGYRSRISDLLNAFDRDFISLTDATVERLDEPGAPVKREFVAVARRHIVFATALGDVDGAAESTT